MTEANVPVLWIDYRERDLVTLLPEAGIENLELGDIQIVWGDQRFVFERKSVSDLQASVKDGRYHEQKARVLASVPKNRFCYLVEGDPLLKASPLVMGAILNTMFRDGIQVMMVANKAALCMWVNAFWERVKKEPTKYFGGSAEAAPVQEGGSDYIDHVKIKSCKRENLTPEVCFELQLAQIPGISSKIAKTIFDALPEDSRTMVGFVRKLQEDPKFIEGIPMIGKKKADVIRGYMGITHLQ